MTKMAARPIYGKNLSKIFFSGTSGPISTKLGLKHRWLKYYNVYINHIYWYMQQISGERLQDHCDLWLSNSIPFISALKMKMVGITVYIRSYAEQTDTEQTDVYTSTRFNVPKMSLQFFIQNCKLCMFYYIDVAYICYLPKYDNKSCSLCRILLQGNIKNTERDKRQKYYVAEQRWNTKKNKKQTQLNMDRSPTNNTLIPNITLIKLCI